MSDKKEDKILILDFGAQYAHLIGRRVRDVGVYSELIPYNTSSSEIKKKYPSGIILSGGPKSVYDKSALLCDPKIYGLGIPILGICYGLQLITHQLNGKVKQRQKREYGRVSLHITDKTSLFKNIPDHVICWMSHADAIEIIPKGFNTIAYTPNSSSAAIGNTEKKIFGVQFHPEVTNTENGSNMIKNFVIDICGCKSSWNMGSFIESSIQKIREKVKNDKVLCALSGGVDSSATALLIHKAIGDNLTCIFIDNGLLRQGEPEQVAKTFREHFKIKLIIVDASKRFLTRLINIQDPEIKRKIIGDEFINVFSEEGKKHSEFQWLAQGTLYPDVIESSGDSGPAEIIKTHHNVGGLPDNLSFKLLEPLRDIYKDEVRELSRILGLPEDIVVRHPFPGPGLGVRIIGCVTSEKLRICRESSWIVEEELKKRHFYNKVWQAFAIVGDDRATGVFGDKRNYGYIVTIRVIDSVDAMTADWSRLPFPVLESISNRITNEVRGVSWVTYAISSKPPSTIEPQ